MHQRSKTAGYVIIILVFAGAFAIRLYHINQPLLDFFAIRQYRTAMLARVYYYQGIESVPEWKKELLSSYKDTTPLLEPPVGEIVTAGIWRIAGGEYLWLPRIVSSIYWLIGGVFLYLIACRLISPGAAFFSIFFYLFWPFNILVGRSIQPEAMLVMLYLLSIFLTLRYHDHPTTAGIIWVAIAAGLAVAIKPYIIFPIYAAFISVGIFKRGVRGFFLSPNFVLFVVVSLLPAGVYYGYRLFASDHLARRGGIQFVPELLLNERFWKSWLTKIGRTTGIAAFIAAIAGTCFCLKGLARVLLTGLWIGYIIFGVVFNYGIHTHDYYQAPLIPIVSVGLGPIVVVLRSRFGKLFILWRRGLTVIGILTLVFLSVMLLEIRPDQPLNIDPKLKDNLDSVCNFFGIKPDTVKRIYADFTPQTKYAIEIGEHVKHSTNTILLAGRHARALMYHGWFSSVPWPSEHKLHIDKLMGRRQITALERFNNKYARRSPEYFIVADLADFARQKDLKELLTDRFGVIAESDKYLIFDLTKETSPQND